MQEIVRAGVFAELTRHAANHCQSISMFGQMREERTDPQAAVAIACELPWRFQR